MMSVCPVTVVIHLWRYLQPIKLFVCIRIESSLILPRLRDILRLSYNEIVSHGLPFVKFFMVFTVFTRLFPKISLFSHNISWVLLSFHGFSTILLFSSSLAWGLALELKPSGFLHCDLEPKWSTNPRLVGDLLIIFSLENNKDWGCNALLEVVKTYPIIFLNSCFEHLFLSKKRMGSIMTLSSQM